MALLIPKSHEDLLLRPLHVAMTTIMPDGSPQMSLVWRLWENPYIYVSSPSHSQKSRNLQREPRLTLLMSEPQNAYRYLEIRGLVTAILPDPHHEFLDKISFFYLQKPYYGTAEPLENKGKSEHLYFRISITKVNVIDYPKLI